MLRCTRNFVPCILLSFLFHTCSGFFLFDHQDDVVRREVWDGNIPVRLELATDEISTYDKPLPFFLQVGGHHSQPSFSSAIYLSTVSLNNVVMPSPRLKSTLLRGRSASAHMPILNSSKLPPGPNQPRRYRAWATSRSPSPPPAPTSRSTPSPLLRSGDRPPRGPARPARA